MGKTILITGASRGIGKAVALKVAKEGASLILAASSKANLEVAYSQLEQIDNADHCLLPIDLSKATDYDYKVVAEFLEQRYKKIDAVIHCAAILGSRTPLEHYNSELFNYVLKVNLVAGFALTKALLPLLKKSDSTAVIFTGTAEAEKLSSYWGAYAISKVALKTLVSIWTEELKELVPQITIMVAEPAPTATELRASAFPAENIADLMTVATSADSYIEKLNIVFNKSV